MKKITIFTLIFIFFTSLTVSGQNKDSWTKVNLDRTIKLENESESMDVLIDIKNNVQRFEFRILSSINSGKLTIEIYDPMDTKRGNFTVGTQLKSKIEESANGNIQKSLFEPHPGYWIVKIIPKEAFGVLKIQTTIREY